MTHLTKFMELVLFACLFLAAMLNLYKSRQAEERIRMGIEAQMTGGPAKEHYIEGIDNEPEVTGTDVIGTLIAGWLEYDIEVDGVVYGVTGHNPLLYGSMDIKGAYDREYIYSMSGKVLKVIFKKR